MADPFGEQWFSEASQQVLARLATEVADLPGEILEVGCWTGRSTCALANAVHPSVVHAIDTWAGSPGEISADLAAQRDVFAQFRANVDEFTNGNVKAHRMGWRDYLAEHTTRIRFIHIDAEHTYTEVADNIAAVLPLMVPGGIICGDDQHHPPIRAAVTDTLGAFEVEASLWWRQIGAP